MKQVLDNILSFLETLKSKGILNVESFNDKKEEDPVWTAAEQDIVKTLGARAAALIS